METTTNPNMIGSEKQVEWAGKIKAAWLVSLNGLVVAATARVECGNMPAVWLDVTTEITNHAIATLGNWTAAKIIDQRNYPMIDNAEKIIIQQYNKRIAEAK